MLIHSAGFYSVLKVSASVKPAARSCGLAGSSERTSRSQPEESAAFRLPLFLSPLLATVFGYFISIVAASRLPNLDVLIRLMLRAVPETPSAKLRTVCPHVGSAARN